jgi:hypothetical protein
VRLGHICCRREDGGAMTIDGGTNYDMLGFVPYERQ